MNFAIEIVLCAIILKLVFIVTAGMSYLKAHA